MESQPNDIIILGTGRSKRTVIGQVLCAEDRMPQNICLVLNICWVSSAFYSLCKDHA